MKYGGHLQFTGPSILRTKLVSIMMMPASASGHPRSRGRLPQSTLNCCLGETGLCLLVRGLMRVLACCPQRTCSVCRNDRYRRAVPTASEVGVASSPNPRRLSSGCELPAHGRHVAWSAAPVWAAYPVTGARAHSAGQVTEGEIQVSLPVKRT